MQTHHIAPKNRKKWHPIWNKCYPTLNGRLWNDKQFNVVKHNYPEYYKIFKEFPKHIMRIDFARLCILHKFGGIYTDLDVYKYKDFEHIIKKDVFNIVEAPYGDVPIENAIMYAPKNCKFLENCMELSMKVYHDKIKKLTNIDLDSKDGQLLVGLTAGPQLVYNVILKYETPDSINILDGDLFNNHGLSYSDEFYTKHVLTGIWGSDALQSPDKMQNRFLKETSKYGRKGVDFDFYIDYTEGQYLRRNRSQKEINESIFDVDIVKEI